MRDNTERLRFLIKNQQDWEAIHNSLFGDNIPTHQEWTDIDEIINVLNTIGSVSNSNHMFFPNNGGMDLNGAKKSHEPDCIELDAGLTYIIKPKSLRFENIDSSDQDWNYFRLETETLQPTGIYPYITVDEYYDEQVTEIVPLQYEDQECTEIGRYNDEPLPSTARPIIRMFKGSFVIFKKMSLYNRNSATYDARHEKRTAQEFRQYITDAKSYVDKNK